jgi:hypothetical protein
MTGYDPKALLILQKLIKDDGVAHEKVSKPRMGWHYKSWRNLEHID